MVPNQMTKEAYLAAKGIGSARNKIELEGLLIVEQSEDPRGGEARPLAQPAEAGAEETQEERQAETEEEAQEAGEEGQ